MSDTGHRTAILFGGAGQDGFHLSRLLVKQDVQVLSIGRSQTSGHTDMSNHAEVAALIKSVRPDFVFHLAANSTTQYSVWQENHATICTGTLNILDAVHQYSPHTRVFLSGSGLQFRNTGSPIDEFASFDARDMYCVSRIQSVYAGRYFRSLGRRVYVGYFFNHDSPLRSERHVNQKIARAVQRISCGSDERLAIGDMAVRKEFGFAGDHVQAVWQLVNQDDVFEAVIGTGEAYSIEQWLDCCFELKGLQWRDYVDASKDFKAEYSVLVSNPATISSLGWVPEVDMNGLARMMVGE